MIRQDGYETLNQQSGNLTLRASGLSVCWRPCASLNPLSLTGFRPQGLASRLTHDAKRPSQHAAGWLASSCPYVSNKRFLLNLEYQTMSDSLKIELHANQTMSDSLKIEFHADQTMSDGLKIEFHADQTMSDGLKIELSLPAGMFVYFASCVCSQAVVCYSFIIIK